jgi:RNA polymerase sigma-70 factor (ECF subfamily)
MPEPTPPGARFPTTRWSRVLAAAGRGRSTADAGAALAELCAAYWYPVYALIRRKGHDPDTAADLAQDYFARLLEKGTLAAADPARGRFRAFLRTDCGFFLADVRDREGRLKRGGGVAPVSIDARDAEGRYRVEPASDLTPDRLFDRAWALALLERALARLGAEYAAAGRAALFAQLEPTLTPGPRASPYAAIAGRLGMTEAAVQQAASRLRKRYRVLLREEVAATLQEPGEATVEGELRDLFAALGR